MALKNGSPLGHYNKTPGDFNPSEMQELQDPKSLLCSNNLIIFATKSF